MRTHAIKTSLVGYSTDEVRQAISVMNKRGGAHERTIRDLRIDIVGIHIGQPLRDFRGVLTVAPIHEKDDDDLHSGHRP